MVADSLEPSRTSGRYHRCAMSGKPGRAFLTLGSAEMPFSPGSRWPDARWSAVAGLFVLAATANAQPGEGFAADREAPASALPAPTAAAIDLPTAVRYALENNPGLTVQRRQRGIAAAR